MHGRNDTNTALFTNPLQRIKRSTTAVRLSRGVVKKGGHFPPWVFVLCYGADNAKGKKASSSPDDDNLPVYQNHMACCHCIKITRSSHANLVPNHL